MLKLFSKQLASEAGQLEHKDMGILPRGRAGKNVSFVDFLESQNQWDLSFRMQFDYYKQCAPFADAVDTIAQAFGGIAPSVWDNVKGEFVDHPVLGLLAEPNSTQSRSMYQQHIATLYLVSGNSFMQMIGNVNREPLSLDSYSPINIDLQANRIGLLGTIDVQTQYISATYLEKTIKGRSRFYASDDKEIWPIQSVNTDRHSDKLYGCAKVKSLFYDIEQLILSGRHNTSLLKRGARPGGAITTKNDEALSDDEFARLQDNIMQYYTGPDAAGRPIILENAEYKENIVNNRDMDYKTMKEDAKESIYNRMDIPLPTVSSGTMTNNNFDSAKLATYDNAVLPVADMLFEQQTLALIPRYSGQWGDANRYHITYDESKIKALQLRRTEAIELKSKIQVNTVNELRGMSGDEALDGGDVILRPANQIPALDGSEPDKAGQPADKKSMRIAMEKATTATGEKRFTESQIVSMIGDD